MENAFGNQGVILDVFCCCFFKPSPLNGKCFEEKQQHFFWNPSLKMNFTNHKKGLLSAKIFQLKSTTSVNISEMKFTQMCGFAIPKGKRFCFLKLLWSIWLIIARSHGFFIHCCFSKTGIQKEIYCQ